MFFPTQIQTLLDYLQPLPLQNNQLGRTLTLIAYTCRLKICDPWLFYLIFKGHLFEKYMLYGLFRLLRGYQNETIERLNIESYYVRASCRQFFESGELEY